MGVISGVYLKKELKELRVKNVLIISFQAICQVCPLVSLCVIYIIKGVIKSLINHMHEQRSNNKGQLFVGRFHCLSACAGTQVLL